MKKYEIVIDSTADLDEKLRLKYNIYNSYLRGFVYYNVDKESLGDMDWKDISPDEYFAIIKKNAGKVKSAFASYEEFARVIEPIAKAGKDVILFAMSSGMSGTYNAYLQYSNIIKEEHPDLKIVVIDTLKYSGAVGLLAIYAAVNRDEKGMSIEENEIWLNKEKFCLHEIGPMDDLRFLAKSGRIAAGKAFFGQLAGVQPLADFTNDGKNVPLTTIAGDKKVDEAAIAYVKKMIVKPEEQIIIVAHSQRGERALKYQKLVEEVIKPKETILVSVGMSCGVNIGPGLCAIFFMGNPISDNHEVEAAALKEITGK